MDFRGFVGPLLVVLSALSIASCGSDSSGSISELPQLATVTVDLVDGSVAVVSQPSSLVLSGTADYDEPAGIVSIGLVIQNRFPRLLFNPKVLVRNVAEGAVAGDGLFAGIPYVYYGPEALDVMASAAREIVVTGVTGASSTLDLELEIVNHPMLFRSGGWDALALGDSSGTDETAVLGLEALSYRSADMTVFEGVISPDGRFLYAGHRNQPMVLTIETTTLIAVAGVDLTGADGIAYDGSGSVGHVSSVAMSPDARFLYAVLSTEVHTYPFTDGGPTGTGSPDVSVVRIDRASMKPLDSAVVLSGASGLARGRKLSLSSNGTRGALAVSGTGLVFLVDLIAMSVIDADPLTPGQQGFDVSSTGMDPQFAALSPDGSVIYVAHKGNDGSLDVIDTATGAISSINPKTPSTSSLPGDLSFGPDGRLYYLRKDGVLAVGVFDPATGLGDEFLPGGGGYGLAFSRDGSRYYVYLNELSKVFAFDIATDALIPNEADGDVAIPITGADFGHGLVVSPF